MDQKKEKEKRRHCIVLTLQINQLDISHNTVVAGAHRSQLDDMTPLGISKACVEFCPCLIQQILHALFFVR